MAFVKIHSIQIKVFHFIVLGHSLITSLFFDDNSTKLNFIRIKIW